MEAPVSEASPVLEAFEIDVLDVSPAVVAEAAPLVILDEQDDDLDAEDHLDADLLPIFEEEATELMPQLGSRFTPTGCQTGQPRRPQRSAALVAHTKG